MLASAGEVPNLDLDNALITDFTDDVTKLVPISDHVKGGKEKEG
jgi:hypothetical protein